MTEQILGVEHVSKSFGELLVLTDASFDVKVGETFGLIGPNGAGKTTLFNIITGFVLPDQGSVRFRGRDVSRLKPIARARAGLVRSFQKSMIFSNLSVRENVALAVRARRGFGTGWWGTGKLTREADVEAEQILDRAGLLRRALNRVGSLSYGEERMVDILVSLALEPALLLLDEPTAGLAKEESERLLSLVRYHDAGTSVVLIAHDLDVVFSSCDRIAVLDLGRMLAVDTPAAIRSHEGVQRAYLGMAVAV
jgi:branched-chain amino acid transport system ATP-binding protein